MQVSSLQYKKLDFEEFCAAAISVYQLEVAASWEQHARLAYDFFEKDGNRPIMIEELASVRALSLSLSHLKMIISVKFVISVCFLDRNSGLVHPFLST